MEPSPLETQQDEGRETWDVRRGTWDVGRET